jgi:murein DD-endopeptidase MepM/ murein hydrolase activator NlpD
VKKNKFTEFFKGKGYYVLLFVGVVAIATVAIIGSQLSSSQKDEGDNYVDINETDNNIAEGDEGPQLTENNPISEGVVNNENNLTTDIAANDDAGQELASNNDGPELEGYSEDTVGEAELADETDTTELAQTEEEVPDAVETAGAKVENLSFQKDKGLLWPVEGNVIMNYSMEHTIYHATLMQYKVNPAIIIDAEVGAEVQAAANGIVSNIEANNEETGLTITMNLGDGYSVVYGQLENVNLEVGDSVNEGQVIGTVQEPTKYYTVEGSNLYFKVMENDQTVNPMLLLR